jgi:hypothetical protein
MDKARKRDISSTIGNRILVDQPENQLFFTDKDFDVPCIKAVLVGNEYTVFITTNIKQPFNNKHILRGNLCTNQLVILAFISRSYERQIIFGVLDGDRVHLV